MDCGQNVNGNKNGQKSRQTIEKQNVRAFWKKESEKESKK